MLEYKNLKIMYMDDIYTYQKLYKKDILEYLEEEGIDPHPNNIEDAAQQMIQDDYDYFIESVMRFDLSNYDKILISVNLGLWNGRKSFIAYEKNLHDAIKKAFADINICYFKNKNSTLNIDASHHDGVNYFKFYVIRNNKKYAIKIDDLLQ